MTCVRYDMDSNELLRRYTGMSEREKSKNEIRLKEKIDRDEI